MMQPEAIPSLERGQKYRSHPCHVFNEQQHFVFKDFSRTIINVRAKECILVQISPHDGMDIKATRASVHCSDLFFRVIFCETTQRFYFVRTLEPFSCIPSTNVDATVKIPISTGAIVQVDHFLRISKITYSSANETVANPRSRKASHGIHVFLSNQWKWNSNYSSLNFVGSGMNLKVKSLAFISAALKKNLTTLARDFTRFSTHGVIHDDVLHQARDFEVTSTGAPIVVYQNPLHIKPSHSTIVPNPSYRYYMKGAILHAALPQELAFMAAAFLGSKPRAKTASTPRDHHGFNRAFVHFVSPEEGSVVTSPVSELLIEVNPLNIDCDDDFVETEDLKDVPIGNRDMSKWCIFHQHVSTSRDWSDPFFDNIRDGGVGVSLGCVTSEDLFRVAPPPKCGIIPVARERAQSQLVVDNLQNGLHMISVFRETNVTLKTQNGSQNHRVFPGLTSPGLTVRFLVDNNSNEKDDFDRDSNSNPRHRIEEGIKELLRTPHVLEPHLLFGLVHQLAEAVSHFEMPIVCDINSSTEEMVLKSILSYLFPFSLFVSFVGPSANGHNMTREEIETTLARCERVGGILSGTFHVSPYMFVLFFSRFFR
jgi:hypothetical protein